MICIRFCIQPSMVNDTEIPITFSNEMLPLSIHWVACGTCYRKSEGTELCGIELQHSSL